MVDFYGFHVGKYTSPMDGMGLNPGYFNRDLYDGLRNDPPPHWVV